MPEHNDLLRNALVVDRMVRNEPAEMPLPKSLFKHEEDDFGSNDNNRRVSDKVAKRLAAAQSFKDDSTESKSESKAEDKSKVDLASIPPIAAPVAASPAPKSSAKQGKPAAAPVWNPNA